MRINNYKWVYVSFFWLMVMLPVTLSATPRSVKQAQAIAQNFMNLNLAKSTGVDLNLLAYDGATVITRGDENMQPAYYIFNVEDNGGYIIVSGDDQAVEVLGYSDHGNIDMDNMSPNLKYWLGFYERQIEYAIAHPSTGLIEKAEESVTTRGVADAIEPLLDDIQWDQNDPFNRECPMDGRERSLTGCVATAMASVMRYYKYPKMGTGSHSYRATHLNKTLSADFGSTTYDWENMLPKYTGNESEEKTVAVATLMFHCGVSLDMDYASSASGTVQNYIMDALINYFGYNPYMEMKHRDHYTYTEWFDMIKEELNNGRPICYGGSSNAGGHSFILDGYDNNGKVHFNWGWGGSNNGYFELNALNPGGGGSGAGDGAYNDGQSIILRLQPEENGTRKSTFYVDDNIKANRTSFSKTDAITFSVNSIYCYTVAFSGKVGIALYQGNEFITFLESPTSVNDWPDGAGYKTWSCSGRIPSSVADGTYQLCLASQDKDEATPNRITAPLTTFSYYTAVIENGNVKLTVPESPLKEMELVQVEPVTVEGNVCQNEIATFTLKLTNTGLDYFKDKVAVYIRKKGGSTFQRLPGDICVVDYKDTVSVSVQGKITLEPGIYEAVGSYQYASNKWTQFPMAKLGKEIEVLSQGSGIEDINAINFMVYKEDDRIVVKTTDENSLIEIYTITGTKVMQQMPLGGYMFYIPEYEGIYIIQQNDNRRKVVY